MTANHKILHYFQNNLESSNRSEQNSEHDLNTLKLLLFPFLPVVSESAPLKAKFKTSCLSYLSVLKYAAEFRLSACLEWAEIGENCGTLLIETTSESITAKVMAILFNVL